MLEPVTNIRLVASVLCFLSLLLLTLRILVSLALCVLGLLLGLTLRMLCLLFSLLALCNGQNTIVMLGVLT
ncbi:MAG: hypothetical protein ACTSRN_05345, partial [Alphaproteobacteria bacterium]